jgi:hypothetical protein
MYIYKFDMKNDRYVTRAWVGVENYVYCIVLQQVLQEKWIGWKTEITLHDAFVQHKPYCKIAITISWKNTDLSSSNSYI